ncbi:cell division protein FtsQ [Trinickia terrae]|uniref:Alginate biosynthesis protein AlgF n=1 Tax=Trinickia terrae TaxID=2571161 RepID=A0A4U1I6A3_9BURK|nr:alginate O-acetyltransferase AlgF [Trinickia terrae]TKC88797.1 cell division protein FtsQ [Trinickia terrae]
MVKSHAFSIRAGRLRAGVTLLAGIVVLAWGAGSTAQEIARLYAPQAPAGSSYLRVVNPLAAAVDVEFAGERDTLDPKRRMSTDYRVVDAAAGVEIKADGHVLGHIGVKPGTFNTVVLTGAGQPRLIADTADGRDDLKAELRFYNLAPKCNGLLAIENGATVFDRVTSGDVRKRVINPVQARLQGRCEAAGSTAPVALPPLKSGDRASVFLLGDAGAPRLVIQADAIEPYSGSH